MAVVGRLREEARSGRAWRNAFSACSLEIGPEVLKKLARKSLPLFFIWEMTSGKKGNSGGGYPCNFTELTKKTPERCTPYSPEPRTATSTASSGVAPPSPLDSTPWPGGKAA